MYKHIKTLIIALPALFALGCGEVDFDPADEPEFAAFEDDSFDITASEQLPASLSLAQQIAAHQNFAQLNYLGWQRVQEVLLASAAMSPLDNEAEVEFMDECQNQQRTLQQCENEAYAMGLDPQRSPTEVQLGQELYAAFGLDQIAPPARVELLRAARLEFVASGGAEPGPNIVPNTVAGVACDLACKQAILATLDGPHAGAMLWFGATGGGSSSTGDGDGDGDSSAGNKWIWEIVKAVGTVVIGCFLNPDCDLWPFDTPDTNECTSDTECASDEYCWKGPLGLGSNECRAEKANGEACSRDGKCLSGCCNFNLFGSKCAVPSKCN